MLEARYIRKAYTMGRHAVEVLREASLTVRKGEFVAIMGASGSGKSTLLHILGALDVPDAGTVRFDGQDVFSQSTAGRENLRCEHIGFIFQFYFLLPELNVLENVLMPCMVRSSIFGWRSARAQAKKSALELLELVGLTHRLTHLPGELSGGERQRVAIARALVNRPELLLADEPTGNLDRETGLGILDVLCNLHQQGQSIVMVTHDEQTAARADRCVHLDAGRLQ